MQYGVWSLGPLLGSGIGAGRQAGRQAAGRRMAISSRGPQDGGRICEQASTATAMLLSVCLLVQSVQVGAVDGIFSRQTGYENGRRVM